MRGLLLIGGLGVLCGLMHPSVAQAPATDLQLSQSNPDMVPLLDSLRQSDEPELPLSNGKQLNEQIIRELAYLRNTALTLTQEEAQRKAAGQAAWLLGLLHLHGAAVSASSSKAKQWFTLALQYGEPMASAGLAWCAYDGCQSAPDRAQAKRWTRQLMSVDMGRALYMQWLLERQLRPLQLEQENGLKSLTQSERDLLEKAVAAGNVHAMIDLGILCAQSHDMLRSLTLFENAATQSDVANQNASWVRQHLLMERLANSAHPNNKVTPSKAENLFQIARKYHRGDGVSVNYMEAIRFYRLAETAGSQAARRMLFLIYARTTLDGGLDPVWMRQLSDMDVSSLVPKQDVSQGTSALHKEPTPLIDLLPRKWWRLIN